MPLVLAIVPATQHARSPAALLRTTRGRRRSHGAYVFLFFFVFAHDLVVTHVRPLRQRGVNDGQPGYDEQARARVALQRRGFLPLGSEQHAYRLQRPMHNPK